MGSLIRTYLTLGFDHILDIQAYDHMLFLLALCAIYSWSQWRRLLMLVTAFTIGHSITLALSVFDIFTMPASLVEFLIPATIAITAFSNLIHTRLQSKELSATTNYGYALFFGLIHGMGFSNFLKASLMPGEESNLVWQLLAFNVGVECGQLIIVVGIMFLNVIWMRIAALSQRSWTLLTSMIALAFSIHLILQTWPA